MNPLSWILVSVATLFILWIFFGGNKNQSLQINNQNKGEGDKNNDFGIKDDDIEDFDINYDIDNKNKESETIDITPDIIDFNPNEEFDNSIEIENINVSGGKFCSKGEKICRATIEKIYEVPFLNKRPHFLKNPKTGHNLELDCYNEELKIAVEYNGLQHYKWPNYFHKNIDEFYDQIEKDEYKKIMCESEGVYLIIVPYNILHKNIPSYILGNLPDSFDEEF